jgi:hypothetical protein
MKYSQAIYHGFALFGSYLLLWGESKCGKSMGKFQSNHRALIPKSNGSLVYSNVAYSIAIGGIYITGCWCNI